MWTTVWSLRQELVDPKHTQVLYGAANIGSLIIQSFLPYFLYALEVLEINIYLGLGLVVLLIALFNKNPEKITPDKGDTLLEEMKKY
jgi:hypothetical protein